MSAGRPKRRRVRAEVVPTPGPSSAPPRRWRRWLAAGCTVLVTLLVSWWWLERAGSADGPIIFISIDTLRADHLPAYGYRGVRTPAIDALAADGTVFERAYAHSPLTLPSHTSILSGRLPFETRVRDNAGFTIGPHVAMLPQMLRDHGYVTGGVVSSFILRADTGFGRGFDFFDSHLPEAAAGTPTVQIERTGELSLMVARKWLDTLVSPKFFLFFHLYEPHTPYAPPGRFTPYAPYDGEIAWADESVAGLLASLRTRGWYDSATIVLFADHGEGLGDHGERRNVVAERPQPAAAMRAALDGLLAGTVVSTPGTISAEDRQRLQALGYVGTQAAVPSNVAAARHLSTCTRPTGSPSACAASAASRVAVRGRGRLCRVAMV